jgi:hypothetical protein
MQIQAFERLPEYSQTVLRIQHVSMGSHITEDNAAVRRSEPAI